jgi:hypothetical protein
MFKLFKNTRDNEVFELTYNNNRDDTIICFIHHDYIPREILDELNIDKKNKGVNIVLRLRDSEDSYSDLVDRVREIEKHFMKLR